MALPESKGTQSPTRHENDLGREKSKALGSEWASGAQGLNTVWVVLATAGKLNSWVITCAMATLTGRGKTQERARQNIAM